MVSINTQSQTGGPKIFLSRLREKMPKKSSNIVISNPPYNLAKNEKLILRLDGCYFELISVSLLIGYIRKYLNLPNFLNVLEKKYGNITFEALSKIIFFYRNNHIQRSINISDSVVFQSNFCRELYLNFDSYFQLNKKSNDKIHIVNNGIDTNIFKRNKDYNSCLSIIVSGRYRPVKRWKSSLKIFKTIKRKYPNSRIIFIGEIDKNSFRKMKSYINKNSIKDVYFTGKVLPSSLPKYFSLGNVFLHPAYVDFCPNSVVEALSMGLPVVYSSNGGTKELVKEAGIEIKENFDFKFKPYNTEKLIPDLDADEYADAISEIYANIELYRQSVKKRLNDLNINNVANSYKKIARKIEC